MRQQIEEGKKIEEISRFYGIDLTLAYATLLEGKSDDERMEMIGEKLI